MAERRLNKNVLLDLFGFLFLRIKELVNRYIIFEVMFFKVRLVVNKDIYCLILD